MTGFAELVERVENGAGCDNSLDVLIEVALFQPNEHVASCRANNAGTKVIYTTHCGHQETYWADEWTGERSKASAALRVRLLEGEGE